MPSSKTILIISTFVAILGLVAFLFLGNVEKNPTLTDLKGDPNVPIGGAFELQDGAGNTVRESDFRGSFILVYFGYTSCPDVCPFDMQKMALALEMVEADGVSLEALKPMFISIDPYRDSPAIAQEFAQAYHDSFMGLSGSAAQIKVATDVYRVYAQTDLDADAAKEKGEYYLVGHSNYIYLMDKNGHYMKHFTNEDTDKVIAKALKSVLDK
jgi:protein SCO1/2